MSTTILEINKNNFKKNVEEIKKIYPNKKIMPIIKANAYGTYINTQLDCIKDFEIIGVARTEEGIELRKIGYDKDIMILNQPCIEDLENIKIYNLTIGLSEKEFLNKIKEPIKVHLEIETGMNRTGIFLKDLKKWIEIIKKNKNIQVEGIYTHFSSADEDPIYTEKQFHKFNQAIELMKQEFTLKYIHCSASNGILNYKEEITNTIRPGIILYGYPSYIEAKTKMQLYPIAILKTKITYIKDLEAGEFISYNQKYKTTKPMKIATIPIGYADGFRRELSNKGEVIIKQKRCKIVGNICMDSCMVDITGMDVRVGEEVYIWNNKEITLEEIAKKCNTINYEIISTISSRIKRVFKED